VPDPGPLSAEAGILIEQKAPHNSHLHGNADKTPLNDMVETPYSNQLTHFALAESDATSITCIVLFDSPVLSLQLFLNPLLTPIAPQPHVLPHNLKRAVGAAEI
jgi:hypothetical protein